MEWAIHRRSISDASPHCIKLDPQRRLRPNGPPVTPELAAALSGSGQPEAGFRALEAVLRDEIGFDAITIMRHDGAFNRRVYSSVLDVYPLGGAKPLRHINWMKRVRAGMPNISNGEAAIREDFTDHPVILGLGCSSLLNLPVYWDGRLLGVLNLLGGDRGYDEAQARRGMMFTPCAIPGLMT
jgi:hypothetical protein